LLQDWRQNIGGHQELDAFQRENAEEILVFLRICSFAAAR
jgi:hypothetical protein